MQKTLSLIILSNFIFILSCSNNTVSNENHSFPDIQKVNPQRWALLREKNVFFGHQSVGGNILDGVKDLMGQFNFINLNIKDRSEIGVDGKGIFAHSKIGKNENPISKIKSFQESIEKGVGDNTDIAFMKFCYIDFSSDTSASEIFEAYNKMVDELESKYKKLKLIHFTVPLTVRQGGVKALVKKILFRPVSGVHDNIARQEYNRLMRDKYAPSGSLFDIAKIESTSMDGHELKYELNGQIYFALNPEFTYDDGHLNKLGRQVVAEKLLCFLAEL